MEENHLKTQESLTHLATLEVMKTATRMIETLISTQKDQNSILEDFM